MNSLKQLLPLLLKTLVFGAVLSLTAKADFSFTSLLIFFAVSFILYLVPMLQTVRYFLPYSFFLVITIGALSHAALGAIADGVMVSASILFYLIMGTKNIAFSHRTTWYRLFNLLLFYAIAMLFFLADKSQHPVIIALLFFVGCLFLLRDFFILQGFGLNAHARLTAGVSAFLTLQAAWALSLLPLGFVFAATALTIFIFMLTEAFTYYLKQTLTSRLVQIYFIIFVVLELFTFSLASWRV